jgi:hypothetical protein
MARERKLIEPTPGDKRYVRRDDQGQFNEVDDVGRSSARDQKRSAKTAAKRGQGDKGDRPAASAKKSTSSKKSSTKKSSSSSKKSASKKSSSRKSR